MPLVQQHYMHVRHDGHYDTGGAVASWAVVFPPSKLDPNK
jgi:hypothetical protein